MITDLKSIYVGLLVTVSLCLFAIPMYGEDGNLKRLAEKMLPKQAGNILFEKVVGEKDFFELETRNGKLIIRGNNGVSMARGLNHYMRHYLHRTISWTGNNLAPVKLLPVVAPKLHIDAELPLRYYLNYCTYSYSMAFWNWQQWEDEIDRMAMQGINMPLVSVIGQYAVWQNTLRRLGYSEQEIIDFLPGAGYEAWWLMGNLEKFGGPVSQQFIDRQTDIQQKMLKRMREYGMEPVLQGFYGMIPNSMIQKFPEADIRNVGKWITFQRPAFLVPSDPLFTKVARIFYEEQEKLFGKARYFAGDPFHEGGNTKGINIKEAASHIYQLMKEQNPQAVWVLQGWGGNPSGALMDGLKTGEAVILDLMACARPQWGGVPTSVSHKEGGYRNHDWIWCALPNFGGRIGMYGKLPSYASGVVKAKQHPLGKRVCGIGTTPEGIGTNPIDYDMVYDMAWQNDTIVVKDWISDYTTYRYGKTDKNADAAMQLLASTVYSCPWAADGPQESFFCARPSLKIDYVSSWGTAKLYYPPMAVAEALGYLLKAERQLRGVDTYRYDVVDVTRQMLADYGKYIHSYIAKAFQDKDIEAFDRYTRKFCEMILDQDRLLSTRKEFLLGEWIRQAEACGSTPAEKELFVQNAKRQITTWAPVNSSLHEYAHKEWNGILAGLYAPRWQAYFEALRHELEGKPSENIDFFAMDTKFVESKEEFKSIPQPDEVKIAKELYRKYIKEIKQDSNY